MTRASSTTRVSSTTRSTVARRVSVTSRLVVLAVIGPVALTVAVAVGVHGFGVQQKASASVADSMRLVGAAQEARFQAADWNGWQTAYAFDVLRGVRDAAANTGDSRKAFLASAAELKADLVRLRDDPALAAGDRRRVQHAVSEFDAFMAADTKIVTSYRAGTAAGAAVANDLVIGEEITHYTNIAKSLMDASTAVQTHGKADAAAAKSQASRGRLTLLAAALVGGALGLLLTFLVALSIRRPLHTLQARMLALADHEQADLTVRLADNGHDELASIAASFNTFVARVQDAVRALGTSSTHLSTSSAGLSEVSGAISAAAVEAAAQAGVVAAAAEQVSANIRTVATGSDEMGSAIREISHSAGEAAAVAAEAVTAAEATTATVTKLGESSQEIGAVVKVISSIAAQTNLLALNATIEAARAGDAGRGFAVVAGEVKELAQETASATEDITKRIDTIQADTQAAIQAIQHITEVVSRINDYQVTIASAVEEQTATTAEMNRNVGEAATGAGDIAANINAVAQAADETTEGVAQSQRAADDLAELSLELAALVATFTV
jgi:methyl-accepting chemotaxis protein